MTTASSGGGTQYELAFSSGAANLGSGPLEIQGTTSAPGGTMVVTQTMYETTGTAIDPPHPRAGRWST